MSVRSLCLAIAVGVAVAACGGAGPSTPGNEIRAGTASPMPPSDHVVERSDWRLAEAAQGDELRVIVPVPSAASCGSFDRVDVSESDSAVVMEAFVRRVVPAEGGACTDDLAFEEVVVDLEQELGQRPVEGCDAPPEGSLYFTDAVPAEGCIGAVMQTGG